MIHALLLLVGLLLMGIACWQFRQTMNLLKNGERAKARVLELVPVRDSDGGTNYRPLFEFVTKASEVKRWEYNVSSSPPSWEVGEEADVVYNPDKPGQARLIGYWGLFIGTIVLAAVAAPCIIIGGGYFVYLAALKNLPVGL